MHCGHNWSSSSLHLPSLADCEDHEVHLHVRKLCNAKFSYAKQVRPYCWNIAVLGLNSQGFLSACVQQEFTWKLFGRQDDSWAPQQPPKTLYARHILNYLTWTVPKNPNLKNNYTWAHNCFSTETYLHLQQMMHELCNNITCRHDCWHFYMSHHFHLFWWSSVWLECNPTAVQSIMHNFHLVSLDCRNSNSLPISS